MKKIIKVVFLLAIFLFLGASLFCQKQPVKAQDLSNVSFSFHVQPNDIFGSRDPVPCQDVSFSVWESENASGPWAYMDYDIQGCGPHNKTYSTRSKYFRVSLDTIPSGWTANRYCNTTNGGICFPSKLLFYSPNFVVLSGTKVQWNVPPDGSILSVDFTLTKAPPTPTPTPTLAVNCSTKNGIQTCCQTINGRRVCIAKTIPPPR